MVQITVENLINQGNTIPSLKINISLSSSLDPKIFNIDLSYIKLDAIIKQYNEKTSFIKNMITELNFESTSKNIEDIYTLIDKLNKYREKNNFFNDKDASVDTDLLE
jgi:hypothetical protein